MYIRSIYLFIFSFSITQLHMCSAVHSFVILLVVLLLILCFYILHSIPFHSLYCNKIYIQAYTYLSEYISEWIMLSMWSWKNHRKIGSVVFSDVLSVKVVIILVYAKFLAILVLIRLSSRKYAQTYI